MLSKVRAAARKDSAIFARVWRHGVTPGAHQYEMAARIDDERLRYQGDFWPRDHGKSEIFCVAYPLRRVCEDPNIRILIVQKTATEAEKTLQVIKSELETNGPLKAYYAAHWEQQVSARDISNATGAVNREGQRVGAWQQRRIYVKRNRRGKDPTIEAVGVGGAITGGHFDVIILDDVEDDENTRTEERMRAMVRWFTGTVMQLREPHTKIVVVGTLKTAGPDIYNFILNNPLWSCRVVPAILSHELSAIAYEPVRDSEGVVVDVNIQTSDVRVLWPEKWDLRALLLDMLASIRSIWIREKLNDLRALQGSVFKREWFRYVERDTLPVQFELVVQVWDTALEETQSADFSVGMTLGLTEGRCVVLDVCRERLEFPQLIPVIQREYARYHPQVVLIEKKASGHSALQVLRQKSTLPVVEVAPGGRDKVARARAVTPFFEGGQVFFVAGAPWLAALEDELTMFPEGAHDDQVDTLGYGVMRLMVGGSGIH